MKYLAKYALFLAFGLILIACIESKIQKNPSQKKDIAKPIDFIEFANSNGSSSLKEILKNESEFQIQFLFIPIKNIQKEWNQSIEFGTNKYFYPASMVKLPTAIAAYEMFHANNLNTTIPLAIHTFCGVEKSHNNVSLDSLIYRALVLSDDNAFNALIAIVGREKVNDLFNRLQFSKAQMFHSFAHCTGFELNKSASFDILQKEGKSNSVKGEIEKKAPLPLDANFAKAGKYFYNKEGKLVQEARTFSKNNYLTLRQMADLILWVNKEDTTKLKLSKSQFQFLQKSLSDLPKQMVLSREEAKFKNGFLTNYFFYGSNPKAKEIEGLKITNMVGLSHGFLSEIALVEDEKTNSSYIIGAVIYTNKKGIVGDGIYEYEKVGLPYLKELSLLIHEKATGRKINQ